LNKGLIRNDKSPRTSPTFLVRNHAKEKKEEKVRIVINYKTLNDNIFFDYYYIPNETTLCIEFKKPLRSRKWILKANIRR